MCIHVGHVLNHVNFKILKPCELEQENYYEALF